jgi:hypothetical protein
MAGLLATFEKLSLEDAHAALKWLTATGKVTVKEIRDALKKRAKLVADIRRQLEAFGGEGLRFLTGAQALRKRKPRAKVAKRVSAARRAAWKAQGRYLAAVRPLSPAQRAKVKKIRAAKGVAAAVAAAKRLTKR